MRNSWLGMAVVAGMIAGCGGGGGSDNGNNSAQLPPGPKTYVAAGATVGDYFTWERTTREQDTGAETYDFNTKHFRSVGADGAATADYLNDYANGPDDALVFGSSTSSADFDSLGRWLRSRYGTCTETADRPLHMVAPSTIAVGMSWQDTGFVEDKCSLNPATQTAFAFKGNVSAIEQVNVPAGSFTTHKVNRNEIIEDGNFRKVSDRTCWWEPELGIDVKCITSVTLANKTSGGNRTVVQTEVLRGYSKQKLARKSDTVLRFIGNWKGRLEGTALGQNVAGTCNLAIDWDGDISGGCFGNGVAFNVTGKVNAYGGLWITASSTGNGSPWFTGKLDSLQQMSGTWDVSAVGNGTWTITQD